MQQAGSQVVLCALEFCLQAVDARPALMLHLSKMLPVLRLTHG